MLINRASLYFFTLLITINSTIPTPDIKKNGFNSTANSTDDLIKKLKTDSGKKKIIQIMMRGGTRIIGEKPEDHGYAITKNIAEDLEIDLVVDYFNPKTEWGKFFLNQALQNPLSPDDKTQLIQRRKKIIEALVNNAELKKEVDTLLEKAKNHQNDIHELFSENFKYTMCPQAGVTEKSQSKTSFWDNWITFNPWIQVPYNWFNVGLIAAYVGGFCFFASKAISDYSAGQGNNFLKDMGAILVGVSTAVQFGHYQLPFTVYNHYSNASEKRKKIHALNQIISIAESLDTLSLATHLDTQYKLSDIQDPQKKQLINNIKGSRYKEKNSTLFEPSLVHIQLYHLYNEEEYLAQLFTSVAEIDACNAIATKMIEQKGTQNEFCFAEFSDKEITTVNEKLSWNVAVKNAVPNSFDETKSILLTGPNASGKSVFIKGKLFNILFSQTFGFAAAYSYRSSKFDQIYSYLNIKDNIKQGDSLFVSELKKAKEIKEVTDNKHPDHKLFIAFDEFLKGTNPYDGQECANRFIDALETKKAFIIYATHYTLKNHEWEHYKVDALENPDGTIKYLYTISRDENKLRFGLKLAEQMGIFKKKKNNA